MRMVIIVAIIVIRKRFYIYFLGEIVAESWGGKRRVDRILVRRRSSVKVIGIAFSTVLAGLTDHIPVALSLQKTSP